jgi:hypothetical protein
MDNTIQTVSAEFLRHIAVAWNAQDKESLEKRIGKREEVPVLNVYKLFMPRHFEFFLTEPQHDLYQKLIDSPDSFEDGFHTKYIEWHQKCFKDALNG